jgi:hypothetical protein
VTPPSRRILSGKARLAFFAIGLAALALTYAATHSSLLQFAVGGALLLVVHPIATQRYGRPVDPAALRELAKLGPMFNPPPLLLVEMYLPLAVWGAFVTFVLPKPHLGAAFWGWLICMPGGEAAVFVADRRVRRDGFRGWAPARPLRDITLLSLALAASLGVPTYFSGSTLPAALLAAALGAGAMATFGLILVVYAKLKC